MTAATFGGRSVWRCSRCGTRHTHGAGVQEILFTCESCGLPFSADRLLPHAEQVCPDCRAGNPPSELPDRMLAAATESEIREALARRWNFVSNPSLGGYLDRLARHVACHVEGAPDGSRAVIVDDSRLLTLALPSGTILLSLGTLAFIEDEAELVFVLAHELAHAASGDAAVRLVRLGFRSVARDGLAAGGGSWADAAHDLVSLGYGRRRERDADLRALEAAMALGYDPDSVLRYLVRLQEAIDRGDSNASEIAGAHPTPRDRMRRLERALYGRAIDRAIARVNRDVFRKAAGPEALAAPMTAIRFGEAGPERPPAEWARRRRALWIAGGVILGLAAAAVAISLLAG